MVHEGNKSKRNYNVQRHLLLAGLQSGMAWAFEKVETIQAGRSN
jgi:hypothetical protein